jgi:CDGSH-type Zn-finger protein
MPKHQHTTITENGKHRTRVTLRQGEVISLCRCWQSKKFPLCDGSHKNVMDERGPVVINVNCESNFLEDPPD